MTKYSAREIKEAREYLLKNLKPGDTVYTILRSVSRSGMMRRIDLYTIENDEPVFLTRAACVLDGQKRDDNGMKMQGCGMDMGFSAVYNLGRSLFPEGFGIEGEYPNGSKGRPTSPEMAKKAFEIGVLFFGRNSDKTGWDNDGGYALKQRWM